MSTVSRVSFHGYSDCIQLSNADTRVVLGHQCGGRILEYSWKGQNVLMLDPAQAGWTYEPGKPAIDPWGGRFDIGPEKIVPAHPTLWLGKWSAEVDASGVARLASEVDPATGVRLIREFRLDPRTSHLRCHQIIENASNETRAWCHWSRTLSPGGGIGIIPLTEPSRFPNYYVQYHTVETTIDFKPQDANIRVRDGFCEVIGTPQHPKLGWDSHAGWMAYLLRSNLLFVKRFRTYPDRVYNEIAGLTVSLWYYFDKLCEIEPIGPMERLAPGASAGFTEDWWLLPYRFPDNADGLDLKALAAAVERQARL